MLELPKILVPVVDPDMSSEVIPDSENVLPLLYKFGQFVPLDIKSKESSVFQKETKVKPLQKLKDVGLQLVVLEVSPVTKSHSLEEPNVLNVTPLTKVTS